MSKPPSPSPEPPTDSTLVYQFDQVQPLVSAEFDVEEALIDHGVPTFYLRLKPDSKQAFTRLVRSLTNIGFTLVLREKNGRNVLKVAPKPKTKPSRPIINVVLLLLTIVTVFTTGYVLSLDLVEYGLDPWMGAASFTLALLGILGVHEMSHKFAANHHDMEATMPYFIPGPPPIPGFLLGIGTFGAVIVQKETAPNKDALFDIGASGPIAGFIVTVFVSAIGLAMSPIELLTEPLPGGLPISPLFLLLMNVIVKSPGPGNYVVYLHPVAFAGWIGMFITLLNLLPTGMLDGGHTLRSIINNDFARTIFTLVSILILLFTGQLLMLAFVLFLSMYKHPGPLDDVSKLSTSRKLVAVSLIAIFALCLFIF
ncbi:MAG: site-2 protease family protein [Candidatus Bathyarchaeota archaeon]|nr:site-2 protease family protein [Candidatus Bathyarchaeota archaeon]MDH5494481.1 site-2 protease family protein [Candidatus Bathyarchaeota archaeon]